MKKSKQQNKTHRLLNGNKLIYQQIKHGVDGQLPSQITEVSGNKT